MGVREESVALLREGLSPSVIAKRRGVLLETILAYLNQKVGEGVIQASDIYFSVPPEARQATRSRSRKAARAAGLDPQDLLVAREYGSHSRLLGDMYEDLRMIETQLHDLVRGSLREEYGDTEAGWWRQGVPENVRIGCHERREQDADPAPGPFNYTDLVDLRAIADKRWSVIRPRLRPAVGDRKKFLADLLHLNQIRRDVMHPVRGAIPSDEDFEFVRDLRRRLGFESAKIR